MLPRAAAAVNSAMEVLPEELRQAVTLREIEPTVTEALRLKVSAWVEAQVTLYIFELQKAVAKARLI